MACKKLQAMDISPRKTVLLISSIWQIAQENIHYQDNFNPRIPCIFIDRFTLTMAQNQLNDVEYRLDNGDNDNPEFWVPKITYECPVCWRPFPTNLDADCHLKTVHFKLKTYSCYICDKSFGHRSSLHSHRAVVHESRKNHKCPNCEYSSYYSGQIVPLTAPQVLTSWAFPSVRC